jgi:hypothetical protein
MQIKRQDFLNEIHEELTFRKAVRKGIALIESKKNKEEKQFRKIIRKLIYEAKAEELKVHDTTGMNYLENLFSNTSFLSDFKGAYNSLATSDEQRKSFQAHILNAMEGLLSRDQLNRQEDDETIEASSLKDTPSAGFDINVTDKNTRKEKKLETEQTEKFQLLPGMDQSGAEAAESVWKSLGELIQNELVKLRDPRDRSIFEEYLIKNVIGYFEEWENAIVSKQKKQVPAATL